MPPIDTAELVRRYLRGESIAAIASDLGASPGTTRRRLLAAGVKLRPAGTPRIRPNRQKLQAQLAAGIPRAEIASTYDVTLSAVSNWITQFQLRQPPPRRPTANELYNLYVTDELSLSQIAAQCDVTKQAVRSWLAAAGIPRRAPQRLPEETAATIAQLYLDDHLTCRDVGQRLGLSTSSIERALEHQGIPRRKPLPAISRQQIEETISSGTPLAKIAQQQHCSEAAVYRAIKRAGLQSQGQLRRQSAHDRTANLRNTLNLNSPSQHPNRPPAT